MTVYLKDRVKQITATTGTGTITFTSTPSGYQSFSSAYNDGDEVYYVIENKSDYEIGVGTYTANTLSRDTVLKSTNGGAKLSLTGRSTVFVSVPAEKTVYIDGTGQASINLDKLSDVIITAPASGEGLKYNGTNWINGNIAGYTDEQAQDAVAGMLIGSTGINVLYNDIANTLTIASTGLLQSSLNLSDLTNMVTARTNLGLGTAALSNSGDFYLSTNPSGYISASSVAAGYQPLDGDLTSLAAATGVDAIYYRSATNTWSPVVIGTGILFSGGTLSNTLDLSSYATSSGVAASYVPYTGASGAVNLGSQSLTAGAITTSGQFTNSQGTLTSSAPLILTQTWNAAGVTFNSMLINITDTASASLSLFADWQVGGVTKFSVDKRGYGKFVLGLEGQDWIRVTSDTAGFSIGTNSDVQLYRDAADTLAQRRSTNAQTFNIANTYTSSTNYEYGTLKWTSNEFRVGTSVGSTGGNQRSTVIGTWNSAGTWSPAVTVATTGATTFANTIYASSYYGLVMGGDVYFARDVASTLELRNSTTAIDFRISGTYTSSTSNEFIRLRGVAASNFEFGPSNGSTGGTLRGLTIGGYTNGSSTITPWLTFTNAGAATFADNITLTGGANGIYISPSGVNKGLIYFSGGQNRLYGQPAVPWVIESDAGFKVRNTANSADAAITAGAITANGVVNFQNGSGVTYAGWTGSGRVFYAGGDAFAVRTTTGGTYLFNAGFLAVTNSTDASSATADTFLSRESAGVWRMGTTSTGSDAGLKCGAITASGIVTGTALALSTSSPTGGSAVANGLEMQTATQMYLNQGSNIVFKFFGGVPRVNLGQLIIGGSGIETSLYGSLNKLELRNSTSSQTFSIYNTFTSSTNAEWFQQSWASNEVRLGTAIGSAGGTQRNLIFGAWDSAGTFSARITISPASNGGIAFHNSTSSGTHSFAFGSSCTASGNEGSFAGGINSTASAGQSNFAHGNSCTASGSFEGSVAHGYECTASGRGSRANGYAALADRSGQVASAYYRFSTRGDAQYTRFHLMVKTTDATPTTMLIGFGYLNSRLIIPSGKMMFADIWLSGIKSDGSAAATYRRKVAIKNVGGTTSLIGSVETIGTDYEDNVLTNVAITADDTNDALQINVTGIAAETWRWVAVVEGLEIAYGT